MHWKGRIERKRSRFGKVGQFILLSVAVIKSLKVQKDD